MAKTTFKQADVGGLPSDAIISHRLPVHRMGLVHSQKTAPKNLL